MRRLAVLLLALTAVIGVSAPQPAAADGPISSGITKMCKVGGDIWEFFGGEKGPQADGKCRTLGAVVEMKAHEEWEKISNSLIGDVIKSGAGVAKWAIKKTLTLGLGGTSLNLRATKLWDEDNPSPLAGMLVWLGLLIAVAGIMWNLAKMAVTGQTKYLGRAMAGWGENLLISMLGVSLFAILLTLGDVMTSGLVEATLKDNDGYERIIAVMVPVGAINPVAMGCVVAVLLLMGFIQMVMVFLRLSAIPIICLMLPIAGAGRTGGETTRKWAPSLITSGLVIIAYKPILAIIVCTGFAEFGKADGWMEWLRGAATLTLAIVAPAPLTRIFAPFGNAVGGAMAAGGASAALGAAAQFVGRKKDSAGSGEGAAPTTPMAHAAWVAKSMDSGGGQPSGAELSGPEGPAGEPGSGAPRRGGSGGPGQGGEGQQAAPPETAKIPVQTSATTPSAVPATNGTGTGAPGAAGALSIGIQVIDGVNDAIHKASEQVGGGDGR